MRFSALLLASVFVFAACVNDLNPGGGWSGITEGGEYLYIGSKDGRVVRVETASGTLDRSWVYPAEQDDDLGEIYGTPQLSDGVIYGAAFRCRGNECDGEVYAVDVETGRSAWAAGTVEYETRLVGSVGVGTSTLAVGTSAIGGDDDPGGFLIGLDLTTDEGQELSGQVSNREKWRIPVDGAVWGGITVADDVAYFGTLGGTLYAVDLTDGAAGTVDPAERVLWSFDADGAIAGTPNVTDEMVYFGTLGDDVFALDLGNRLENPQSQTLNPSFDWRVDTGEWVWAKPLLEDGTLYVATLPGRVFALDAATGGELWPAPAQAGKEIIAQPVVFESNRGPALAVASGEKDISIITLASGQVSGQFVTRDRGMKSSPVIAGNVLFVHTDSGQLRQYQTETLSLLNCIEAKGDGKGCD